MACVTGGRTKRLLIRTGRSQQKALGFDARLQNAHRSYCLRPRALVPERVVLVDDVFTTGATLAACASILAGHGAKEVVCVTFAMEL
jgi:predicted amidophosphoribosyltransferase